MAFELPENFIYTIEKFVVEKSNKIIAVVDEGYKIEVPLKCFEAVVERDWAWSDVVDPNNFEGHHFIWYKGKDHEERRRLWYTPHPEIEIVSLNNFLTFCFCPTGEDENYCLKCNCWQYDYTSNEEEPDHPLCICKPMYNIENVKSKLEKTQKSIHSG